MIDIKELKNSLTKEIVYQILKDLKGEPIYDNNGNIISKTICHNGDSHKLYYYDNSKMFHCYTHCGENFDIIELVEKIYKMQMNKNAFADSIKFLMSYSPDTIDFQKTGFNFHSDTNDLIDEYNNLLTPLIISSDIINDKYFDNAEILLKHLPFIPCANWLQEGISIEAMKKFEIRYYPTSCKIVIPHKDDKGKLVGIRGRALVEEDMENGKYMPLFLNNKLYNHPLSHYLYGLNLNLESIKRNKRVIIFEAEKSVMQYETMYPDNNISVAVCGSSISQIQRDLLLFKCQAEEIILAFDKQYQEKYSDEYNKLIKHLCKMAQSLSPYCQVSILFDNEDKLDYKDSPTDKGKEVFEELFKNRIMYKEGIL